MRSATRLDTDMASWMPVTRHYAVNGGHLAVTVSNFLTATGTHVYYCDERAVAYSMEPISSFPAGTSHDQALEALGYSVIDTIGEEPALVIDEQIAAQEQSVLDILPPAIAEMVNAAIQEGQTP